VTESFPLPEQIGPYKIERLLKKGGLSLIYLGVHPAASEPLVIKVLLPKYLKHQELKARFLKEAKIIETAHHPNIVRLYDVGEWEQGLYIAMEFIRGVSLRQFIQEQSFSLQRAVSIILEIAEALAHLHAHGVIHRDLKPENILIAETGAIKLIDFGISQLISEEIQTQKRMGTPFYMSPEQLKDPAQITPLTDIYALGIIAYELILGKSICGIIQLSQIPPPWQPMIEKALQADPALRYQNIRSFIADMSVLLE
jgi:serine/threonine protein kinase